MASRSFKKLAVLGTAGISFSALSLQSVQAQAQKKEDRPSIYDNEVLEVVYIEDKPSRLEAKVKELRIETNTYVSQTKAFIQSYVDQIIKVEQKVEDVILNLVPKNEEFVPNSLYVGIIALSGSVVARNRNIIFRLATPLAFGIASSYYFLPGTTENVSKILKNAYLKYQEQPTLSKVSATSPAAYKPLEMPSKSEPSPSLEKTITEVQSMYTTRADPGVRAVLEDKASKE